ncbi:response regulator [Paenibacillus sinopodophylli]|uniref:response regulator n=1 Tax=Paenibacillus sinopodophylli TaxID=1837342 RepID=UPI00110D032E|nr:response regulator [Paenibacillus sinopodophylli]
MYRILLVDDEAIELETIEHYVPWDKTGITVAGTARNGKEALGKLAELKPDIVLTDVRMPIMDGLEFGRRAKQIDKNVKIIYLSGHNEFQYIKAALNLEAAGYLLKPIDMEELLVLLEKVKKKCEEDQLADQSGDWVREKLMMRMISEPDPTARSEWIKKWEQSAVDFVAGKSFTAAYMTFDPPVDYPAVAASVSVAAPADKLDLIRTLARQSWTSATIVEAAPHALFVLHQWKDAPMKDAAIWESFQAQLSLTFGFEITIGLSSPRMELEQIWDAYVQARSCNEEKFYRIGGSVIAPEDLKPTVQADGNIDLTAAKLSSSIQAGNMEQIRIELETLFMNIQKERMDRNFAIRGIIRLLTSLEQHFSMLLTGSLKELLLADHWKAISMMPSAAHIQAYVLHFCDEMRRASSEREIDRNQAIAEQMVRIIAERHHLPLTVEEIAKEVYLSPNYIRTIFKEKMGETILDYLTKVRINHAAELLKDKALKVREVAHSVGYENVSYFCSIFHKHKGSTPNEFRKMYF